MAAIASLRSDASLPKPTARLRLIPVACFLILAGIWLFEPIGKFPSFRNWQASSVHDWRSRDPFSAPGYLSYDDSHPLESSWIPFSPSATSFLLPMSQKPSPDWLSAIRNVIAPEESRLLLQQRKTLQQAAYFANATVLLIGDSVDRNIVQFMGENLHLPVRIGAYKDIKDSRPPGWDERSLAHVVEVPAPLHTTFANCFFYGLDDHDDFSQQIDWHGPGKAEDRIDQLCKPVADQLVHPPTLIQLHSGLWDCAYFGRMDKRNGESTETPLTLERMHWWIDRMVSVIRKIKKTWPGVPIVYRGLHRPTSPDASTDWTSGQERLGFANFFTDVRVAQIRSMQEHVARQEQLHFFDFGRIWEGYQALQFKVHPNNYPGGVVQNQALLHFLYLAVTSTEKQVT